MVLRGQGQDEVVRRCYETTCAVDVLDVTDGVLVLAVTVGVGASAHD